MKTKNAFTLSSTAKWLAIAGLVAGLSACGGGGGGGSSVALGSSSMSVSGTAAKGAALAGASVSATCASGTGTATAAADGTYRVTIVNGAGPCLLTATLGSTVLRSVTPGAGVANITPLTQLLVDYLAARAGTTGANLLNDPDGKAIMADASALSSAQSAVVTFLATKGVNLSTTDFLTATITTPQSGGTPSATDADLEKLVTAGLVGSDGAPTPSTTSGVVTGAPAYTAPTGGTGGSGGSN